MNEPVEIQAKNHENERLWKKKDGSLVNINTLTDEELILARKISSSLLNKYYTKKEDAILKVKQYSDISDLHGDLLVSLDNELKERTERYVKCVEMLQLAEQEI